MSGPVLPTAIMPDSEAFRANDLHHRALTRALRDKVAKAAQGGSQAARYATGDLREVYFYPDQLKGHVERRYHPGG